MAGSGAGVSRFAGAVMLGGLDDFIAPSQSCVNPLFVGEKKKPDAAEPPADPRGVARITLDLDDFARPAYVPHTRARTGEGLRRPTTRVRAVLDLAGQPRVRART